MDARGDSSTPNRAVALFCNRMVGGSASWPGRIGSPARLAHHQTAGHRARTVRGLTGDGAQPPLTSVDMRLEEVGRVAAGLLLAAIAGEPAQDTRTVPSRLVVRESSR